MSLWPIFNVADSAISIGIVCILLFQGRLLKTEENTISTPLVSES
jgi:lipoprotein signal peptidase